MPVAFVVLLPGTEPNAEELKHFTIANGPAYQHPRHIFFETDYLSRVLTKSTGGC